MATSVRKATDQLTAPVGTATAPSHNQPHLRAIPTKRNNTKNRGVAV